MEWGELIEVTCKCGCNLKYRVLRPEKNPYFDFYHAERHAFNGDGAAKAYVARFHKNNRNFFMTKHFERFVRDFEYEEETSHLDLRRIDYELL